MGACLTSSTCSPYPPPCPHAIPVAHQQQEFTTALSFLERTPDVEPGAVHSMRFKLAQCLASCGDRAGSLAAVRTVPGRTGLPSPGPLPPPPSLCCLMQVSAGPGGAVSHNLACFRGVHTLCVGDS